LDSSPDTPRGGSAPVRFGRPAYQEIVVSHWRTRLFSLAACLFASALVVGQPPAPKEAVPPTVKVEPGGPAVKLSKGDVSAKGKLPDPSQVMKVSLGKGVLSDPIVVDWVGDDFKLTHPSWLKVVQVPDPKAKRVTLYVIGYREGRAEIHAIAAGTRGEKAALSEVARIQVTVRGDTAPTTDDKPPADGTKKADKLIVVVVEETSTPFRNRVAVRDALIRRAQEKGHTFVAIDQDIKDERGQTPAKFKHALEQAAGKKLPYVAVYDDKGKFLGGEPLPTDPADALGAVKKYEK